MKNKICVRPRALRRLRAFFRVVRVFFLFMGLFSWRIAKKILSPLVACGESYIFTPMRRGCAEAFFPIWENFPRIAWPFPGLGKLPAGRVAVSRFGKASREARGRFPIWESFPRGAWPFPGVGKLPAGRVASAGYYL